MSIEIERHKNDNLNNTYIWHCGFGHINNNAIPNLHGDVYLGQIILNHLTNANHVCKTQ